MRRCITDPVTAPVLALERTLDDALRSIFMSDERIPCIAEGCKNTILPATAKANNGYCMPCVHARKRAEREAYIRENRREVDPYEGLTDPVDIIRVIHTRRPMDPLIVYCAAPKSAEELYAELTIEETARLMELVVEALRNGNEEFAEDIAKSLAILTDYPLDQMLLAWVERENFYPPIIFRGAGPAIRDSIVAYLEAGKPNRNHALLALVWVGDTKVAEVIQHWEDHPPQWTEGLFVGPAVYAHAAGWEPSNGKRRDLIFTDCRAVAPAEQEQSPAPSVHLMRETSQPCRWCKHPMVHLIEIDLRDERFAFLGFSGPALPILTCEVCTCYAPFLYAHISLEGVAQWAPENTPPEGMPEPVEDWEPSPWRNVPVTVTPRRAIHAADWTIPVKTTQIGGHPSWVQDSEYPSCPRCSRTMMFIGQVDQAQFPMHEGIYYAFLCATCRISATSYQQT